MPRSPKPTDRRQVILRRCYIALTVIAAVIVALFVAWKLLVVKPKVEPAPAPPPVSGVTEDGTVSPLASSVVFDVEA